MTKIHQRSIHVLKAKGGPSLKWSLAFNIVYQVEACIMNIQSIWTPIKPITTQFTVGRNRTAQVVRKQFPLRPAAAKTIRRSQGDTESIE